jgi:hypothetical protein
VRLESWLFSKDFIFTGRFTTVTEVVTAVTAMSTVYWDVTSCSLVGTRVSDEPLYQATQHHNLGDAFFIFSLYNNYHLQQNATLNCKTDPLNDSRARECGAGKFNRRTTREVEIYE